MAAKAIISNFETFLEATRAVPAIRALILHAATTGKLTSSHEDDLNPPTAIRSSEGKQSRLRSLPASWGWVSLGDVIENGANQKIESSDIPLESWLLDLEDIERDTSRLLRKKTFQESPSKSTKTSFLKGDILYGKLRPYLNKVIVADGPGFCTTEIVPLRPTRAIDPDYLCYALKRPAFLRYAVDKSYGMNLPRLGMDDLLGALIPLPPLKEQVRIVAQVNRLMDFCSEYEEQRASQVSQRSVLTRAALKKINERPDSTILGVLLSPELGTDPGQLLQCVIDLAVQGKLATESESDESVPALLDRITKQRVQAGSKVYPQVTEGEIPYDLPARWHWVRLGNITLNSEAGWSPQCLSEPRDGDNWGVLKISAISWGRYAPEENKALPPGMQGRPECEVREGDFLLSRANTAELVARSVVVKQTPPRLMMSDKIVRFQVPEGIDPEYLNLANLATGSREYYARHASGTSSSMKNVGREVMCSLPIALPPRGEQRRIVEMVSRLGMIVDQLSLILSDAETAEEDLLEATINDLAIESA